MVAGLRRFWSLPTILDPRFIAADFLSQAETRRDGGLHSGRPAPRWQMPWKRKSGGRPSCSPKKETVFQSLENYGTIIVTKDMEGSGGCGPTALRPSIWSFAWTILRRCCRGFKTPALSSLGNMRPNLWGLFCGHEPCSPHQRDGAVFLAPVCGRFF